MKQSAAIVLDESDNVATAMRKLAAGTRVKVRVGQDEDELDVIEDINFLHKFALRDIKKGGSVIKYGRSIGKATTHIHRGEHVHIHNLTSIRGQTS